MVALAMGARKVIVPTHSTEKMDMLHKLFENRVVPVLVSGNEEEDAVAFKNAAGDSPIDYVLDLLDPKAALSILRSSLSALRPNGTMILMGGNQTTSGCRIALSWQITSPSRDALCTHVVQLKP